MSSPNASANTNTNDVDAGRTPRELRLENLRQVRRQRRQLELDRQPTRNQRPRETPPAAAAAPNGGGGGDGNGGAEAAPPPFVASGEGADSNPNGGTGGTGGLEADSNPNGGTGGEDAAAGHAVVQAGGGGWGVWPMLQSLLLSFVPGLGGDGGAAAAANAAAEAARDNREILGIVSGTQASIIGNIDRLTANVGGVTSSLETETEARQREAAGLRLMVEALEPRTDRHLATAAGQDGGAAAAAAAAAGGGGGGEAQVRAMISTTRAEDSEIYWEVIDDFHRLFKEVFGLIKALQATVAGQGAIIRALQEQLAELQGNGGAEGAEEEEEG